MSNYAFIYFKQVVCAYSCALIGQLLVGNAAQFKGVIWIKNGTKGSSQLKNSKGLQKIVARVEKVNFLSLGVQVFINHHTYNDSTTF